jgi:CubicO group peptidase (beta-lactamase class C family)
MKKDPKTFTDPNHNAWRLVPASEVRSSAKAAAAADEAKKLLEKVITEHPGTPWALLAQRELRDPFGFQWVGTYVAPPPKPSEAAAQQAQAKKAQEPPRREPPKL